MESTYDEAYKVGLDSFLTDICGVFSSMRANEKIKDVVEDSCFYLEMVLMYILRIIFLQYYALALYFKILCCHRLNKCIQVFLLNVSY